MVSYISTFTSVPETNKDKKQLQFWFFFFIQEYTLELQDFHVSIDHSLSNKFREEKVISILSP